MTLPSKALPETDQIVFALWRAGEPVAAREVARCGILRSDRRSGALRAQLGQLDLGEPLEELELLTLDFGVATSLVLSSRFGEARQVLRVVRAEVAPLAIRLATLLDRTLSPFPAEADPSFGAVLQLVRAGQAPSCLRALEQVVARQVQPPRWLIERERVLRKLVEGTWWTNKSDEPSVSVELVLERVKACDLRGAFEAAKSAHDAELTAVLRRLVAATAVEEEEAEEDDDNPQTLPVEGHPFHAFQVRIGSLAHAEMGYRRMLRHDTNDQLARQMLSDVIALRIALGESVEMMPSRQPTVDVLRKNVPRNKRGWSSVSEDPERYPRFEDTSLDDSTDVLEPAAEAELLLKLGKAERALDIYRLLSVRHPDRDRYRRRIQEIEALLAQRMRPLAAEATDRHDLRALSEVAVPTNPKLRLNDFEDFPKIGSELDEEVSTEIMPLLSGSSPLPPEEDA